MGLPGPRLCGVLVGGVVWMCGVVAGGVAYVFPENLCGVLGLL